MKILAVFIFYATTLLIAGCMSDDKIEASKPVACLVDMQDGYGSVMIKRGYVASYVSVD